MSYSNISDVLLEFNNKDGSNQNCRSALALSNTSEMEIKNLLKQVDTMIHHKKLRWERQKQDLDNRLQIKEQDLDSQRTALEQKNYEIESLKKLLESMEISTQDIMKKYENEINILNEQLNKLKADYIRIQKKYKKKKSSSEPDTPTPNTHARDSSRDVLRDKSVSQHPAMTRSTGQFRSQIFNVSSSASSSSILSSVINGASTDRNAATRIKKNSSDQNHVSSSKHNDYVDSARLNTNEEENKLKNIEFFQEREKINKSLEHYKKINKELLKKVDELNQAKQVYEINFNEFKTNKLNMDYYKQELRKRDDYIRDLEALDKADNIELQFYKDEVKKLKKQEVNLKAQIEKINELSGKLQSDYDDAISRLQNVENENKKLKSKLQICEEKSKNDEILLSNFERDKDRHSQDVFNLKNEITALTSQLTEKSSQLKSLADKSNRIEHQLKEKEDQLSKSNQELIMTVAHVEALRLENHFLRQSLEEKKSDEKEIVEMQKKYHHVIDLTEKENKRLKNEIVSLSECVESLKSKVNTPTRSKNNQLLSNDFENRRAKLQKEEHEKQIESLKKQHELSIKRLNNEIEKLYSEKHLLIAEMEGNKQSQQFHFLTNERNNLNKPNRSNASSTLESLSVGALSMSNQTTSTNHANQNEEVMRKNTRYFKGMDNYRLEEHSMTRNSNTSHGRFHADFEPIEPSPAKSTRMSIATQLKFEEQRRKKDLENMLDVHIDSLRRSNEHANGNNNFI